MDARHKISACIIAKSGSSTMKRIFWVLSGNAASIHPQDVPKAQKTGPKLSLTLVNDTYMRDIRNTFMHVIVVREPIGRLWSTYMEKLYSHWEMAWHFLGEDSTERDRECQDNVTFVDLLRKSIRNPGFNVHVQPYTSMCKPCVRYDAVVKLETFYDDMMYVIEKVKATRDIDLSIYKRQDSSKEERGMRMVKRKMKYQLEHYLQRKYSINGKTYPCGNSSLYANRLWKSMIWRNYVPSDAPYPQLLQSGSDVTLEQVLDLYGSIVQGKPYEKSSYKPKSKEAIIREAFSLLTNDELVRWYKLYGHDFQAFGYQLPPYLAHLAVN